MNFTPRLANMISANSAKEGESDICLGRQSGCCAILSWLLITGNIPKPILSHAEPMSPAIRGPESFLPLVIFSFCAFILSI